ncbi:hypothetical protein ACM61V_06700 [Sphingomonas sp. TX0543]|nr:hypothetical protein [Sphingomonas sp. 3P27F8]
MTRATFSSRARSALNYDKIEKLMRLPAVFLSRTMPPEPAGAARA